MNNQEEVDFKLELARAFLENGQEGLARNIIKSIIEGGQNA
jgi:Tfp pilus assembly protein FimV